jgi:hypothetical protein
LLKLYYLNVFLQPLRNYIVCNLFCRFRSTMFNIFKITTSSNDHNQSSSSTEIHQNEKVPQGGKTKSTKSKHSYELQKTPHVDHCNESNVHEYDANAYSASTVKISSSDKNRATDLPVAEACTTYRASEIIIDNEEVERKNRKVVDSRPTRRGHYEDNCDRCCYGMNVCCCMYGLHHEKINETTYCCLVHYGCIIPRLFVKILCFPGFGIFLGGSECCCSSYARSIPYYYSWYFDPHDDEGNSKQLAYYHFICWMPCCAASTGGPSSGGCCSICPIDCASMNVCEGCIRYLSFQCHSCTMVCSPQWLFHILPCL